MALRSVLDRSIPPLPDAERLLEELARTARNYAIASLAIGALAWPVGRALAGLGIAAAAGAASGLVLALKAWSRRRRLLAYLMRERDAYSIEAVRGAGVQFASPARRRNLAGWLRRLVSFADTSAPRGAYSPVSLDDRVRGRRERLLAIADVLESGEQPIHPASVALLHQLLTRAPSSPLYNRGLDEDLLDFALHRVEAGVGKEMGAPY